MSYKKFVITVVSIVSTFILVAGSFIYYIDPLWLFSSSNKYNDVQVAINERQQKMNHIQFQPFEYDSLLLGSSRSTYINQYEFEGEKVYNFAVSNISVREYNAFIEFAKQRRGKEFDTIYIGLDFFKTSLDQSNAPGTLDPYIEKISDPFFRVKSLFSWDALGYAYDNYKLSKDDTIIHLRSYNRENVAVARVDSYETISKQTDEKIERFKEVFYGETYQYNENYASYLQELKDNNPNTKFVLFTTPISTPLFQALVDQGLLSDYERWLNDVVAVFGEVHNYMYPNSVTNNITNYFDGHHFYPEVGSLLAKSLSGNPSPDYTDFGVIVTTENLKAHVANVEQSSKTIIAEAQKQILE